MKIGILGWDYEEFETLDLMKAGQELGHEMFLFTLADVRSAVVAGQVSMSANGRSLHDLDVIISRAQVRPDHWQQDHEVYTMMEEIGLPVIDPASTFLRSESKLHTMQKLAKAGLNVPETFQCQTVEEVQRIWQEFGAVVVKPSYGFAGCDVERIIGDFADHISMLETKLERYGVVLVQRYIPHPDGDIRTTVVGEEIVFGIRRIPNEHTWKANIALGATYTTYQATEAVRDITMRAVKAMEIVIAGLDILEYEGKHYILEVNKVPGWYAFPPEEIFDFPKKVIRYAEQWALQASQSK